MHSHCKNCNKPLTDPRSVRDGLGPGCRAQVMRGIEGNQGIDPLFTFLFEEESSADVVLRRGQAHEAMTNIRQTVARHSPSGLEWGYSGSGPADLALNILLKYGMPLRLADRHYQEFKEIFIAPIPVAGGRISGKKIRAFIAECSPGNGTSPASINPSRFPDSRRTKDAIHARR